MATPRIRLRDTGGTLRTLTRIRMRDAGGTLRTITRIRMRDQNNVLRTVYDPSGASTLTATANRDFVVGSGTTAALTTDPVTVTATGGTAPYTYAWTELSHDHPTTAPAINSPTAATTDFTQTNIGPGESYSAQFRCTVTDSASPANTAFDDVGAVWTDTTP